MYLLTWISILDNHSAYIPSHIYSITSEEDHKCWQMEAFLTDNKDIYISNNVEINKDKLFVLQMSHNACIGISKMAGIRNMVMMYLSDNRE